MALRPNRWCLHRGHRKALVRLVPNRWAFRGATIVALILLLQPTLALAAPSPTIRLIHPIRLGASSSESTNWSGFAVTGSTGSVSEARGSWVVPSVAGTCTSTDQYSSFWVGIDGFSSSTVEQTGTDSDCQSGSPTYYAWYEFYPNPSYLITSITVHPGDKIGARVVYSGGSFTTFIKDLTTGQSFSISSAVSGAQRNSAEWIAEAPSDIFGVLPLAYFGTVDFGFDYTGAATTNYASVGGSLAPIGSYGSSIQSINMIDSKGNVIAQTSALSSDGTSFTVQRLTAGAKTMSVSASTSQPSYSRGSTAVIKVHVSDATTGTGISGASVSVKITAPTGQSRTLSGSTNSNGDVSFSVPLPLNAPTGTYQVSASATAAGYTSGSATTSFGVT
jgi:hypothetical protein